MKLSSAASREMRLNSKHINRESSITIILEWKRAQHIYLNHLPLFSVECLEWWLRQETEIQLQL